jgi:riboflavin kinase/FMN adenylyltransferase
MEIYRGNQLLTETFRRAVVTIGNFDGVHLGHQRIISTALEKAQARKGMAVAYTFRPHPQVALRPEKKLSLLTTYDEKLQLLASSGLDVIIEEPFSREFSTTPPEKFFEEVLLKRLGAEAVVVGHDFAFGKERAGHLDNLERFCKAAGVELTVVPPLSVNSEVVSSSKIRQALLTGNPKAAALLLGRPYFYRGIVQKGDARGRLLGFPTANLKLGGSESNDTKLLLPNGVYATLGIVGDRKLRSVTNVGVRPTFESKVDVPVVIETHLLESLGGSMDLYGNELEVQFIEKIRDEKKFSGVDELKAEISKDILSAETILGRA